VISLEKTALAVRRSPLVGRAAELWWVVRPLYKAKLRWIGRKGLPRNINGTDLIVLLSELYTLPETYEPDVWASVMAEVHEGNIVADVGAHIGLYTLAFARRVGAQGHVYAFEPDPETVRLLRRGIDLNGAGGATTVLPYAVGEREQTVRFATGRQSESHVATVSGEHGVDIDTVTLDKVLSEVRLDLLQIDVEGYKAHVLRGARQILTDPKQCPSAIFIEVHPYAWDLSGNSVLNIQEYGEIIARRERF
jgi:FkbM family methyltransferase